MARESKAELRKKVRVIKGETAYKANTADRVGTFGENVLDSYLHLDDVGLNSSYVFPPVDSTLSFPTTGLSGKNLWMINAGGKLFYLNTASSATVDDSTIFAAAGGGRWILMSGGGGGGGGMKTIMLKWAVPTPSTKTFNLSTAVVLNGVTGTLPDIVPTGIVSLDTGAHQYLSDHYTSTARTITILGTDDIDESFIYFVYGVPGTGGGGGGTGGPSNTVSQGDQIIVTPSANVDGSLNYQVAADPKVVTNQVNAVTPALVDTIMLGNNTAGSQIKSSGKKIAAPMWVAVPASNASIGISGQRARNTTNGNVYSYDHGQWWWDNAPTTGERKTFTT